MKTKGEGRIGRIGARNRLLTAVCTLCFSAAVFSSTVYAGTEGTWERTEDGKYWKYVYAPDRQAIDEWIEIDGKEYRVGHTETYVKAAVLAEKAGGNQLISGRAVKLLEEDILLLEN